MHANAQRFFKTAIVLLLVGMGAGIGMAASHDHSIAPAHAHLNLIGFVVTSVYGAYFALFPAKADGRLPTIIWGLHTGGILVMFPTLALLLRGETYLEPAVALSSIAVFVAAILFAVAVWRPAPAATALKASAATA